MRLPTLLALIGLAVSPAGAQFFGGGKDSRWQTVGAGSLAARPTTCAGGKHVYLCLGSGCTTAAAIHYCTSDNTWTVQVGATANRTEYVQLIPAVCQGSSASLSFSTPTANYPEAVCIAGTNTTYAAAAFDAATAESVQTHLWLPPGQTGAIDVVLRWRAAATSGDVVWSVQTACVAAGETADPSWNTASTVTDTAQGTTLQWNDATLASVTATGCAADEELFVRLSRQAAEAADTMSGDAQLASVRFTIRRTY